LGFCEAIWDRCMRELHSHFQGFNSKPSFVLDKVGPQAITALPSPRFLRMKPYCLLKGYGFVKCRRLNAGRLNAGIAAIDDQLTTGHKAGLI
jgi:hypothetical protein